MPCEIQYIDWSFRTDVKSAWVRKDYDDSSINFSMSVSTPQAITTLTWMQDDSQLTLQFEHVWHVFIQL
jgi:hypothetical protein